MADEISTPVLLGVSIILLSGIIAVMLLIFSLSKSITDETEQPIKVESTYEKPNIELPWWLGF